MKDDEDGEAFTFMETAVKLKYKLAIAANNFFKSQESGRKNFRENHQIVKTLMTKYGLK
ncbi:MAG: hypothetical protein AAGM40_13485 [Cyanobacteria bacterium J06573_2]